MQIKLNSTITQGQLALILQRTVYRIRLRVNQCKTCVDGICSSRCVAQVQENTMRNSIRERFERDGYVEINNRVYGLEDFEYWAAWESEWNDHVQQSYSLEQSGAHWQSIVAHKKKYPDVISKLRDKWYRHLADVESGEAEEIAA